MRVRPTLISSPTNAGVNQLVLLAHLATISLLGACGEHVTEADPFVIEVEGEAVVGPSWDAYREGAVEADDGSFVVEGDLYFPNEQALREHYEGIRLEEYSPKLAVFQQISTGFEPVYQGNAALDIVYCVSNTVPSKATIVQDMATATGNWQENANVRFRYNSTFDAACSSATTGVDFAVVPTTQSGLAGCGYNKLFWAAAAPGLCSSGPGTLQVQYSQLSLFPGMTGPGLLRHELGHILGFRHEHPWAPSQGGCGEGPIFASLDLTGRRLTNYDQLSVMHYSTCSGIANSDSTISALDQLGAISSYGIPAAWYTAVL